MTARRLRSLPRVEALGYEVPVASGLRVRLFGLSHLDSEAAGPGLLIPRCASVHTFGMRFALDVFFLDERGAVLAIHRRVAARRALFVRGAHSVLEIPSSQGGEISTPWP